DALLRARAELDRGRAARSDGASVVEALHYAQADSLAQLAAAHDPAWSGPHLLLAEVHELQAMLRFPADGRDAAASLIDRAIASAVRAVQLGAGAPALERRGGLHYLAWALGAPDADTHYDAALRDLVTAVQDSAAGAHAWVMLAALHENAGRLADADAAARTALRRDV
ncbi:MAG TPA: hypothetical protein VMN60_11625, partial [Longimicrobiales bacterium]|nr:hypothetical protein [Longimicrobiales bacterium]